jgi:hypothetical protein
VRPNFTGCASVWNAANGRFDFTCGGVSSFSAGNLPPLFTTSVANPGSTPSLSFTLNTQAANRVFAGPANGVDATPTFRALVAADIPALSYAPLSNPVFSGSVGIGTAPSGASFHVYDNNTQNLIAKIEQASNSKYAALELKNAAVSWFLVNGGGGGVSFRTSLNGNSALTIDTTGVTAPGLGVVGTNGGSATSGYMTELIALSNAATTTDSTGNLLPANSIIKAVACRVISEITVATDWSIGDSANPTRFASAKAVITAGTTTVGLNHTDGGVAAGSGMKQSTAAKQRITTTGVPGAGSLRCTVFYETFVAPTS